MKGTWETTDSGWGTGGAISALVILGAVALVMSAAEPAAHAALTVLRTVLVAAGVVAALVALAVAALVWWRVRARRTRRPVPSLAPGRPLTPMAADRAPRDLRPVVHVHLPPGDMDMLREILGNRLPVDGGHAWQHRPLN